eukprot:TRINITY_DN51861_c0_g1_i1.p2 TRINITY_DN51861_c0_g1~~TRINITY_DN51861_c0_g1_i1.p2  ORF type:complete len:139 (-),score=27.87 TRINITY_DN51861_c0_g1_i1:61-477(-)
MPAPSDPAVPERAASRLSGSNRTHIVSLYGKSACKPRSTARHTPSALLFEAAVQAGDAAGMHHVHGDVLGTGMAHDAAAGFMGDLVGKHDEEIGIAELAVDLVFLARKHLQLHAMTLRRINVFTFQPVHSTNKRSTHV